jgi:hypothetical protein
MFSQQTALSEKDKIMFSVSPLIRTARMPLTAALLLTGLLWVGGLAHAGEQVPFKEHLVLVDVSADGVATYVGTATHMGQVLVYWDLTNGTWMKFGANGDALYGYAYPDGPATGPVFVTGGSGRFEGATGQSRYWAIELDPVYGIPVVGVIEGTLSRVGDGH